MQKLLRPIPSVLAITTPIVTDMMIAINISTATLRLQSTHKEHELVPTKSVTIPSPRMIKLTEATNSIGHNGTRASCISLLATNVFAAQTSSGVLLTLDE